MKKEELKDLTVVELNEKERNTKVLIGLFLPIILALIYFIYRDYMAGEELKMPGLVIVICSIVGMASLFPGLKIIREELRERVS